MTEALCEGPECGRCASACPADVVQHWDRDWAGCDRLRSPHGFAQTVEHFENILGASGPEETLSLVKSKETFHIWMSILRGAGVTSGCRRCQDVCPVGEDYNSLHKDALDEIPEDTNEKQVRLAEMLTAESEGKFPASFSDQATWIGSPRQ